MAVQGKLGEESDNFIFIIPRNNLQGSSVLLTPMFNIARP